MTGHVCPVHGEWSATGACRWCETGPRVVEVGRVAAVPAKPLMYLGMRVVLDRSVSSYADAPPMLVSWGPKESAVAKAARDYSATRSGMAPLFSTRQRYSTPEGIASHNAFWEAKLTEQHAALRWERVARRWNYKHCGSWTELYLDMQRGIDEMHERLSRSFALPDAAMDGITKPSRVLEDNFTITVEEEPP